jgi:ribosomal-protein-alanine N-acetyltransferase
LTHAPERIETARLVLQRPRPDDADAIFRRYASDPDVTRYLSWPLHVSVEHTRAFLAFSDEEWRRWPAGPYLVWSRDAGRLLGSTGLTFEAPDRATTGYVFARDAWGHGYATEALEATIDIARAAGVRRLQALCHVDHRQSARVLEKCGFAQESVRREFAEFPNLTPGTLSDVFEYVRFL